MKVLDYLKTKYTVERNFYGAMISSGVKDPRIKERYHTIEEFLETLHMVIECQESIYEGNINGTHTAQRSENKETPEPPKEKEVSRGN